MAAGASICALPTAAATPVQNPARRGRYPQGVTGLRSYERRKTPASASAHEAELSAQRAQASSAEVVCFENRGHPVGAILFDCDGNEVRITKPLGWHKVAFAGRRLGYAAERVDTGQALFYAPCALLDADGFVTHLRDVWTDCA